EPGPGLRHILHDQDRRPWYGIIDLPLDHRSAWRTCMGDAKPPPGCRLSVPPASAAGDRGVSPHSSSPKLELSLRRRPVYRMNRAKADCDAVPCIDRSKSQCRVDEFRFGEMLTRLVVDGVGNMGLRDQCHRIGPD